MEGTTLHIIHTTIMTQPTPLEQFRDMFLLRVSPPDYAVEQPFYTTGSIASAALMRIVILIALGFVLRSYATTTTTWTVTLFAIWALGIYPAWRQYSIFNAAVDAIVESTLCGTCRHFNPSNQVCHVLDVHITSSEPPCESLDWEPR